MHCCRGIYTRGICAQAFLNSAAVKAALNQTGSALAALTVLKKVACAALAEGMATVLNPVRLCKCHVLVEAGLWHRSALPHGLPGSASRLWTGMVTDSWHMWQVCDHPALLSNRATRLVTSGGQKLAAKEKGRKGCSSLGGFLVDDDATESSGGSWSGSNSDSGADPQDEEVPAHHTPLCILLQQDTSVLSRAYLAWLQHAHHVQVGAPRVGELHEPEDGASWCNWAEGSMEQKLLAELKKRGAAAAL